MVYTNNGPYDHPDQYRTDESERMTSQLSDTTDDKALEELEQIETRLAAFSQTVLSNSDHFEKLQKRRTQLKEQVGEISDDERVVDKTSGATVPDYTNNENVAQLSEDEREDNLEKVEKKIALHETALDQASSAVPGRDHIPSAETKKSLKDYREQKALLEGNDPDADEDLENVHMVDNGETNDEDKGVDLDDEETRRMREKANTALNASNALAVENEEETRSSLISD